MTNDDEQVSSRRGFLVGTAAVGAGFLTRAAWPDAAVAESAAADAAPSTPDAALQRLLDGNRRFAEGKTTALGRDLEHIKTMASKQTPFAALLSCADSRVPVEIVFDQGFGDLFVVRIAGNVVGAEETASLEYGTLVLGAKVIVVLGHTGCGAVKAAHKGDEVPGQISTLFRLIGPGIDRQNPDLDAAVAANVRRQASVLRDGSTVIAGLVRDGKLKLAGGVYDLASGKVKLVEL